jgi:hypothetical protein
MTEADIVQTVLGLQPADFYKSMTTYGENKVWQDVYKPFAQGVPIIRTIHATSIRSSRVFVSMRSSFAWQPFTAFWRGTRFGDMQTA